MSSLLRHIPALLLSGILIAGCASAGPYQGMNLEEVMEIGMQHYEDEEWEDAIEAFETVIFGAQGLESAAPARYYMAASFFGNEEYITASAEYERFLERFPTHELAPEAALGICRSYAQLSPIIPRDQSDTRRAYQACTNAALDFPGTEAGQTAAEIRDRMWNKLAEKSFHTGEFYYDRELYDSALIYYEDVVQNYPRTPTAPEALWKMHLAYEEIGYEEEAQEARQRLLRQYPDSDEARNLEEPATNSG